MFGSTTTKFGSIRSRRARTISGPSRTINGPQQLSRMAAEGSAWRPAAARNKQRRSWTMASKTPAANQRWVCWYTMAQGGRSWGIMRHAPADLDDIAQRVEHLAQAMASLHAVLRHERQVRHHERPFLIGDVARVRLAGGLDRSSHLPYMGATSSVPNRLKASTLARAIAVAGRTKRCLHVAGKGMGRARDPSRRTVCCCMRVAVPSRCP